ncbi:hypothetical protein FI667_g3007, partial [Globisporangium splendens]
MKESVSREYLEDSLLVDGLCAYEDYLNEHQRACEKLKQVLRLLWFVYGFLKLTMARRNLPAHALSDLSYHGYFDAVTMVAAQTSELTNDAEEQDEGDDNGIDVVQWILTSPGRDATEIASAKNASLLTQRKGKANATEQTAADDEEASRLQQQQQELQNSTIMWFSSLPPNDLRQAQKHFRSGTMQCTDFVAWIASLFKR